MAGVAHGRCEVSSPVAVIPGCRLAMGAYRATRAFRHIRYSEHAGVTEVFELNCPHEA